MIVAKKSYSTVNYAAYDNYAYDYKDENHQEQSKKDTKETRVKPRSTARQKLKLVSTVALMLMIGMLVVGRYAMIMDLNSQSISVKNKISENQKLNEGLKLQLMKYSDIKQIEKYASTEKNMVRPENYNIVYIDVAGINQNVEVQEVDENIQKVSLLERIISFFEW